MGFHECMYVDYDTALKIGASVGLTEAEVKRAYRSSCETVMTFASDNRWVFPDMLPLYVAFGFRPEQPFIDDVVSGSLTGYRRMGSMGGQSYPGESWWDVLGVKGVGYLQGEPLPLKPDPSFAPVFIARLKEVMEQGRHVPPPAPPRNYDGALPRFRRGFGKPGWDS